jgi:hypothetical protein
MRFAEIAGACLAVPNHQLGTLGLPKNKYGVIIR